ncbi:hypothetical protein JCM19239_7502 [Vibrio variabilis]|uniref:Uncharacterized protein n=1 Tax=Vibrio variabilis TaxID=990271 RepID=A0ABQ0JDW6_9VIBR|nr:hypothetical protein JCM19239_7502 [Vibrio variabilis]
MTEKYQLLFLALDVRILKTRLQWLTTGEGAKALNALKDVERDLDSIRKGQSIANRTSYRIKILQAEIASAENEYELAEEMYQRAKALFHRRNSPNGKLTSIPFMATTIFVTAATTKRCPNCSLPTGLQLNSTAVTNLPISTSFLHSFSCKGRCSIKHLNTYLKLRTFTVITQSHQSSPMS